jgi:probable phosphoglycerate mutase
MGWPKTLTLVRHAESEGNVMQVDERAAFHASSHAYKLTARGRAQARLTGEWLRANAPPFDVFYVSYYTRAKETMEIMFPEAKVYEDSRLAEANRGHYHVLTHEQMLARYPEEVERKKREGLYHYRPFGGENWPDIEQRIHSFLGTLTRDCEDEDVVIVVHGHWLILFQKLVHRFTIVEALRRYHGHVVANASVTRYEGRMVRGKSRLVLMDEVPIVPWEGKL